MMTSKVYDTEAVVDALLSDPSRSARHHFIDKLDMDKVVAALLRLTMEISVLRDRLDTHESLAQKSGAYSRDDIETFEPSLEEETLRSERRERLVARLIRDLTR